MPMTLKKKEENNSKLRGWKSLLKWPTNAIGGSRRDPLIVPAGWRCLPNFSSRIYATDRVRVDDLQLHPPRPLALDFRSANVQQQHIPIEQLPLTSPAHTSSLHRML